MYHYSLLVIGGVETYVHQVASVLSTRNRIDILAHTDDRRVHLSGITTLEQLQVVPAARSYHYPITQPLGFQPRGGLQDGISQTVAWYRESETGKSL